MSSYNAIELTFDRQTRTIYGVGTNGVTINVYGDPLPIAQALADGAFTVAMKRTIDEYKEVPRSV